jgi:hypothetical protein
MKGGSAMLIATVISSTFSATSVEANMLTIPSASAILDVSKSTEAQQKLNSRIEQLGAILLNFKQYHYDICENKEAIEPDQYQDLLDLEITMGAHSRQMKKFFYQEGERVRLMHGEDGYQSLRKVTAAYAQLHKVISNVTAFYAEQLGLVEVISNTHFTPTKEFWLAATQAGNKAYGRH